MSEKKGRLSLPKTWLKREWTESKMSRETTSTVTIHFTVQKRLTISIHYVNWVFIPGKICKFNCDHLCLSRNHDQFEFFFFFEQVLLSSQNSRTRRQIRPYLWGHVAGSMEHLSYLSVLLCSIVYACMCKRVVRLHVRRIRSSKEKKRDIPPPLPPPLLLLLLTILHLSATSQLSACLPAQRSRTDAVPIRLVI